MSQKCQKCLKNLTIPRWLEKSHRGQTHLKMTTRARAIHIKQADTGIRLFILLDFLKSDSTALAKTEPGRLWMQLCLGELLYDAVSDVVESGVHWRSNFQIGSRVLKNCYKPILMHIYGIQCDFMHRSCWNHSNFENSWFYYVIWTSDPQNHCLLGSRNRVAVAVE